MSPKLSYKVLWSKDYVCSKNTFPDHKELVALKVAGRPLSQRPEGRIILRPFVLLPSRNASDHQRYRCINLKANFVWNF